MLTVRVSKPKDVHALFNKAKSDAEKHGISWAGDITKGYGTHRGFEAEYLVDEDSITVNISKKPIWATRTMIEREISKYITL